MQKTTATLLAFTMFSCAVASLAFGQNSVKPLAQAHAHNDYEHDRPLMAALAHGFCSVEADIFLVEGQLLVGHDRWALKEGHTLKKLYLDPLLKIVRKNNGRVYNDGPLFTLLLDFKSEGDKIYPVLKRQLEDYMEMLSGMEAGNYVERAIQVVISGSCPRELISNDPRRLVSIDGRLSDLDTKAPSHLMPLISDRWGSHFKWRGQSEIPPEAKEKLNSIVKKAHAAGRRVRFWATPESQAIWNALLIAGVDHINTDKLQMLQKHLLQHSERTPSQSGPSKQR